MEWIHQVLADKPIVHLLDILIVWYLIYRLLMYARGTRAMNLLKGVAIIIAAKFLSAIIGLQTIDWFLGQIISWGVIASIILFQPELRKALESLGRNLFRNRKDMRNPSEKLIDDLEKSALYMSKRKIGALISIEGNESLNQYIQSGLPLDSEITNQLLINIFIPNTPLHDGAVIISNYRISAAACYLPLSESSLIPKELGTRHRAAIGLGEVTDALTLIVSEETGGISLVKGDHLHRNLSATDLHMYLVQYLIEETDEPDKDNKVMKLLRAYFSTNFRQGGER
ncbi:diadenylate cyclase CdaA [Vaginisenegalia massiliensis]|uniref:diadenylate cyclase CdaA n=1 Tax=Vaginisenegalia massiliensis TaxID=2058294 RepID=UPI000F54AB54|nr:diadenylate cyclase CdaA [Vaginisenegalia massiliensis]